jgi:hypothetical protein
VFVAAKRPYYYSFHKKTACISRLAPPVFDPETRQITGTGLALSFVWGKVEIASPFGTAATATTGKGYWSIGG